MGSYKDAFKGNYRDSIRVQGLGPTWRFMGSLKGPFEGIYRDSIRGIGFRAYLEVHG